MNERHTVLLLLLLALGAYAVARRRQTNPTAAAGDATSRDLLALDPRPFTPSVGFSLAPRADAPVFKPRPQCAPYTDGLKVCTIPPSCVEGYVWNGRACTPRTDLPLPPHPDECTIGELVDPSDGYRAVICSQSGPGGVRVGLNDDNRWRERNPGQTFNLYFAQHDCPRYRPGFALFNGIFFNKPQCP